MTLERHKNLKDALNNPEIIDIAPSVMSKRMIKSKEEIDLILPTSDDVEPISLMRDIYYKGVNLFMSDYHSISTCHNKFLFYKKLKTIRSFKS